MNRVLGLAAAFALVLLVRPVMPMLPGDAGGVVLSLGFVLLAAYFTGQLAQRVGLPALTGHMLLGLVLGPHLLADLAPRLVVLSPQTVQTLQLLDNVALGLIALSAGGELHMATVRRNLRAICWITGLQVLGAFSGVALSLWLLAPQLPMLAGLGGRELLAALLLLGVLATPKSPATTIAVLQETGAHGPLTDIVLAVTIAKDVVVVVAFSVVLSLAIVLAQPGAGLQFSTLALVAWELVGSLLAGLLLGWLVARYLDAVGHELPLLVLGLAFIASTLLPAIHLSGLLTCMVAGFYIQNGSAHGEALMRAVAHHALPVYLVFFTLAGASLDLDAFVRSYHLALLLAGLRLLFTGLGTAAGARIAGSPRSVERWGWSGFIGQAGVTLGFALLIEQRVPGLGVQLKPAILGAILINQLVGPVLFRLGLRAAGEIPTER